MIAHSPIIPSSEITPKALFYNRRHFMQLAAGATLAGLLPSSVLAGEQLANVKKTTESLPDKLTPFKDVTNYNNFYEFGTGKEDPALNAGSLKTRPWTITVEGEVHKPKVFDIEELLKLAPWKSAFIVYVVWKPGHGDTLGRLFVS